MPSENIDKLGHRQAVTGHRAHKVGTEDSGTSQQLVNEDETTKSWEEGLKQDGPSKEKKLRERYELFVHYDLSDVDMKEDSVDTLIIEQIQDEGFIRRVITNHEEWGEIILKSK